MTAPDAPHSMNIWSVTAMGIGAMVGAGIFALLGVVALAAGDLTYVAFLIGGCIAALSGYSYAKLSARYPDAGGIAVFFDRAFGAGRVSGMLSLIFLLTLAATIAMVAKAFGSYAAPLAFGAVDPWAVNAFASAIILVLALLNFGGSKFVGKAEILLVGIKLSVLAMLICAGGWGMTMHAPITHAAPRLLPVIGSVGITMLAYAGFGMMPNAAGSVANPKATIPHAIYLAIAIVTLVYVALAVVVVDSVPVAELSRDANTVVAVAARPVLGQAGYIIVSITALLATASCINSWIFTTMQIATAMAKAGQLPQMFAHLFWRQGTLGLLLSVAAILIAINVFDLTALASIASATFVLSHMAVHIAHWRLIDETKGSRLLVGLGLLTMSTVLAIFLWSIAPTQPWALGLIAVFLAGSWGTEYLLSWLAGAKPKTPAAIG